ncbi:MAG: hypothetical protein KDB53_17630, partial [Planctomycetes bacterium]|nr:hypothetical protein [Planctomycetota bacterium]
SLGLRGRRSDAILAKAHEALTRWLNDHPDYELAGSLRVMGYNGPMVPVDRRFYEVELPIKRATSDLKL